MNGHKDVAHNDSVSPLNLVEDTILHQAVNKSDDEDAAENEGDNDTDEDQDFWNNLEESDEPIWKRGEYKPSAEEVERHMITHWPFRSWCDFFCQRQG